MADERDIREILRQKEEEDKIKRLSLGESPQTMAGIPVDEFLFKQMLAETSGRSGVKHPLAKYGKQKGQRAIGDFALMPNTVEEFIKRNPENETLQKLKKVPKQDLPLVLGSNDQAQLDIARVMAEHVLKRQKGDEDRAGYAWETGHNLYPEQITDQELNDSDRLKRLVEFEKLGKIDKFRQIQDALNQRELSSLKPK